MSTYQIIEVVLGSKAGYCPIGGAADLWRCKDHEVVVAGPAETGKTFGCLQKLDGLAWKYPGLQAAIVRLTYKSMVGSVLQTYTSKVLGKNTPVKIYGGQKPEWFDYPNGSRVWLGGMDNPDKVLSSERDVIYVNQAEELILDDWQTLATRCTGRAGNMPYPQLMGDCNPGPMHHWILERAKTGNLTLLKSEHKDNPALYDIATGLWTEQGLRTMAILDGLTGPLKARLKDGKWVSAEGVVYEDFDYSVHVKEHPGPFKYYVAALDEGYTNPAVILVAGVDNDDRLHLVEEFYRRRMLQGDVVAEAGRLCARYGIESLFADPSAAGLIADMQAAGLPAMPANNDVAQGIQAVKARLALSGDGRPRLTIDPSCTNTITEFESYIWKAGRHGLKDEPEKVNDHSLDALRYLILELDGGYHGSLLLWGSDG